MSAAFVRVFAGRLLGRSAPPHQWQYGSILIFINVIVLRLGAARHKILSVRWACVHEQ
jgi:hypothetical protein